MRNRPGAGVAPALGRDRCVMNLRISASPPLLDLENPISSGASLNLSSSLGGLIGACEAGY